MRSDRAEDSLEYLRPLFEPNPTGAAKVLAAWDGLQVETQIRILQKLDHVRYPVYLAERIRKKAIDSPNSYIRYLAARGLDLQDDGSAEEQELKRRIEQDSDPLVKYAPLEQDYAFLHKETPEEFFSLPQEARLAKVRSLRKGGKEIASLIDHALTHDLPRGTLIERELFEILSAYIARESFKKSYEPHEELSYDSFGEYRAGEDVEALWRLVPRLPEAISPVLIENLPFKAGLSAGIPGEVLENLTDGQLETLLYRRDVPLQGLRKRLYFEDAREGVRLAAASSNFDLTPEEFARVLAKPERERVRALCELSWMASDLSLPVLEATHDCLFATPMVGTGAAYENAAFAKNTFNRRLQEPQGWTRDHEIRELRLYYLAREAVPWEAGRTGYPPSGELEFLANCVVAGETWATYSRMSEEWARRRDSKTLERHLPRIPALDKYAQGDESDPTAFVARLGIHLARIAKALATPSGSDRSSIPELVKGLAADLASAQRRLDEALETIEREVAELRSQGRVLGYFAVALIVIVSLTSRGCDR
jgi:hypothetical protein